MNIRKTTIVSMVFTVLFSTVSVMGAVTIVNSTEFNTAQSGAVWRGSVIQATNVIDPNIGIDNSSAFSLTKNYSDWRGTNSPGITETVTTKLHLEVSGGTAKMTIGPTTTGPFAGESSNEFVSTTSVGGSTTLWVGIRGQGPTSGVSFEMFNMFLNDESLPGSLLVNGTDFDGFNAATDGTVNFLADIRTIQDGGLSYYRGSQTLVTVFGDNTPVVPEPGIPTMIGIAGVYMLLRKRRT